MIRSQSFASFSSRSELPRVSPARLLKSRMQGNDHLVAVEAPACSPPHSQSLGHRMETVSQNLSLSSDVSSPGTGPILGSAVAPNWHHRKQRKRRDPIDSMQRPWAMRTWCHGQLDLADLADLARHSSRRPWTFHDVVHQGFHEVVSVSCEIMQQGSYVQSLRCTSCRDVAVGCSRGITMFKIAPKNILRLCCLAREI